MMRRIGIAALALSTTGCLAFRGGPAVVSDRSQVSVGGAVGMRVYDQNIGHFYDSIRPTVGAVANVAVGSNCSWRVTAGPEVGLDRYWTDEEHGAWAFRGIFARGEAGFQSDEGNGHYGHLDYWGGGTTLLFDLGKSDQLDWGLDLAAGSASARDGSSGFSGTMSVVIEWP
jgi:hypothetical protein